MSQHVKAAMLATKGLGKNDRAVAVAIAAHMNKAGDAWPSVATIAEYADCSERTVQRSIARLINLGRIAWRQVAAAVQGVTSTGPGVTNDSVGAPDRAAGGDSQGGTRSGEGDLKERKPRGARDWRSWIPKSKPGSDPVRRGAALPPPSRDGQCPEHRGWLAHNCGPCRADALAGGAR
jgi:hypothetical protein